MLHQFLAILFITIVILVVICLVKVALPMWRFMSRVDAVINLYSLFKELLKEDFSEENKIRLTYDNGNHKYKLEFSNTNEASIEFEKIVQEALEYYEKLGRIATIDNYFKAKQEELWRLL